MCKTVNACFSVTSLINSPEIDEAKEFLAKNFGSKYSIQPHVTFSIMPLPEYNIKKAEKEIDAYFKDRCEFTLRISSLELDIQKRFFYLNIHNPELRSLHIDLINLLSKYREGFIREKDALRIEQGYYDRIQIDNIYKYGFPRVLEHFQPHITIGNITNGHIDPQEIKLRLETLLISVMNTDLRLKSVSIIYHTDSTDQSKFQTFMRKDYVLK